MKEPQELFIPGGCNLSLGISKERFKSMISRHLPHCRANQCKPADDGRAQGDGRTGGDKESLRCQIVSLIRCTARGNAGRAWNHLSSDCWFSLQFHWALKNVEKHLNSCKVNYFCLVMAPRKSSAILNQRSSFFHITPFNSHDGMQGCGLIYKLQRPLK